MKQKPNTEQLNQIYTQIENNYDPKYHDSTIHKAKSPSSHTLVNESNSNEKDNRSSLTQNDHDYQRQSRPSITKKSESKMVPLENPFTSEQAPSERPNYFQISNKQHAVDSEEDNTNVNGISATQKYALNMPKRRNGLPSITQNQKQYESNPFQDASSQNH